MNVIYLFWGGGGIVPKTYDFTLTSSSISTRGRVAIDIINNPTEQISLEERFTGPNGARSRGHVVTYSHPQRHSSFMYCLGLIVSTRAERS